MTEPAPAESTADQPAGWTEVRRVRCGKPTCRCRTGPGHGPYRYQVWRDEQGHRCTRYLGPLVPNGSRQRTEPGDTG
ncbi:MAG: hypothetical protein KKB13_16555 [Chloroflexi bacterium]|nr:hypothetical protein [Chloroflexota bacterium]